jgi:hypothetical protein
MRGVDEGYSQCMHNAIDSGQSATIEGQGTWSERMAVAAVVTSLNTTKPCSFIPPAFFATTSSTAPN